MRGAPPVRGAFLHLLPASSKASSENHADASAAAEPDFDRRDKPRTAVPFEAEHHHDVGATAFATLGAPADPGAGIGPALRLPKRVDHDSPDEVDPSTRDRFPISHRHTGPGDG